MRKIILNNNKPSPLLPPLEEFLNLLEIPSGVVKTTLHIAKKTGKPTPVDKKTLRKLESKGVKKKTFKKIIRFILQGIETGENCSNEESIFSYFNALRRKEIRYLQKQRGNSRDWLSFIYGIEESGNHCLSKSFAFIRNRCNEEMLLFKQSKREDVNLNEIANIYNNNLLINKAIIQKIINTICLSINSNKECSENILETTIIKIYFDFYFWLLSYIEIDLREAYLKHHPGGNMPSNNYKIFSAITPRYKDGKYIPPISLLLDRWRKLISTEIIGQKEIITWSELAHYLPDPVNSDIKKSELTTEKTANNKYRELCSWRSAQVIPSNDKLKKFINNLLPPCTQREWWFWITKSAVAMDKIHQKILKETKLKGDELEDLWRLLSKYQTEAKKRAATN